MADEQEAPQGKSKLMIIIVAVVVLVLGGGGAAFFMMGSGEEAEEEMAASPTVEVTVDPVAYVNIPQPFVFNVTGDKRDRLIQIKVDLMVRGIENENLARYHTPLIESSLLSTFATATVRQLRSPTGRIDLRERATDEIKAAMNKVVGQPVIEKVLFTDFVIQ